MNRPSTRRTHPLPISCPASTVLAGSLCLAGLLSLPARAQQDRDVYEPNWQSLNARQTPQWFADAKLGIFIHWGVYSVPAICDLSTYSEWYQWWLKTNSHNGLVRDFHNKWHGEDFAYHQFAEQFRAELWDPHEWAEIFKNSGAKYVVLVSKHHDGYALWPNESASDVRGYPWNSVDVGPKRDLCGELAEAVRDAGLRMGFYYSFMEWENPLFDSDKQAYVDQQMIPQIKELLERYEPAVFWPDGEWNEPDTLWRSEELLAWIYNNCPNPDELVVNDRWGKGLRGHSGDYYTTEYGHVPWAAEGASDESKPWEECRGIGHSFAWNRLENLDRYLERDELIQMFIDIVSRGGNLLLNIGPRADGKIPVIQQDRLAALGRWLDMHGEAIYATTRGPLEQLAWGRTTLKGDRLFLHVFDWPEDHVLRVPGLLSDVDGAVLMHDAHRRALPFARATDGVLEINLLGHHPHEGASVIELDLAGRVRVDERVHPDASGVITLDAARADLHGGVQLEHGIKKQTDQASSEMSKEPGTNIGYWSNAKAHVAWRARVKPRTAYRVMLDYACSPGEEGSTFRVEMAGAHITHTLREHTGDWQTYRRIHIGNLLSGEDSEATITIRCDDLRGSALMNVRRLILVPER